MNIKKTLAVSFIAVCLLLGSCSGIRIEKKKESVQNMNNIASEQQEGFITLGSYDRDRDVSNGPEPIQWIPLKEQDGSVLVISKEILEIRPYDSRGTMSAGGTPAAAPAGETDWEGSSLRKWLNQSFFASAFADGEEKDRILRDESGDRLFLLSEDELNLIPEELRAGELTDYCRGSGADISGWMLAELSAEGSEQFVSIVKETGEVARTEAYATHGKYGVRPAMWIRAD